ncbi:MULTISPECIES: cyd operon YbgE family protein [unclassified Pseudomonas]|uniref:cyd operon YbgE family protein n=1 Tax=unclassified Pseudomonas TaxID=196821 RepID=UPI0002A22453|nr:MULTISPECIES: cyd operon YbgE family protein [unclassified Pseudomonas]MBB1608965.1 Cyd operon protein YbgE [Pseudomonas sp. UMC76]MBB1636679.1 Cyd operon protein YbgE [Pseudomonas sp. UME83]NTX88971.1 Cyd operon protein YbgE [Pseudomonas sp. UMA643]NTY17490.1 Cyd operon protein YbgE [Pseudomonas sp. UMC3103]NTY25245.1 Cyd operon protein YbgE [Pseudomonas sp. UMA603]
MTAASPERALRRPWSRVVSLLLAAPLALVLLIHPALMLDANGGYSHGLLMLVMLGVSGGFVHGVGFDPRGRLWALLFGPPVAWPLMLLGYGLLLYARTS